MESRLTYLTNQNHHWLICPQRQQLPQLIAQFSAQLTQFTTTPPKIILAEREPVRFIAGFLAATTTKSAVFLCNPDWGENEWQQVLKLVQPDIIWADETLQLQLKSFSPQSQAHIFNLQSIMIATGGSSGKIKFAIHTWETLTASVKGFQEYFQLQQINSYCILPLYHVSGLMQLMRSLTSGGILTIQNWKQLELNHALIAPTDFISLVPTQLQRLLQNSNQTAWLAQFKAVLLGGAPAWAELLAQARHYKICLAPTYGMTETASQIATLKPEDFFQNKHSCGKILPHAKVTIRNHQGEVQINQIGNITIQAKSLMLGYYPHQIAQDYIQLDDVGFIDNQGHLNIIGRSSDKIITGGENVYPAEIESIIRDTQLVKDICVIGIPDPQWGQAVIAIYVPKSDITANTIQTALKPKLSTFKIPKHWLIFPRIPRNAQGKINRKYIQQLATTILHQNRSASLL